MTGPSAGQRQTLRHRVAGLYRGTSQRARRFRYGLIGFDVLTVLIIVVTQPLPPSPVIVVVDLIIGLLVLADVSARTWIEPRPWRHLVRPSTLVDLAVVVSLLLAAVLPANLAFLRVLRLLRLLQSYQVLRDLRRETAFFRRNEDVIVSTITLVVFIFVVTAMVFALQHDINPAINSYLDALYFTVTTLTTTGFGDITLTGAGGRLLAVIIMVVGVALFLRLIQTVFRPRKVRHACQSCGLSRHDLDAVHCKHCGETLHIQTEGES
ncbi:potassium channel family protein [Roseospira navarrensis]|uniref:Ion transporter n=1 Tax=Roseospira navarrensis TaxID=140058 RepID=A0A7X1ZH87_9PROT|nr:potassium channel family protein [Roseospira navarrensis]MQX38322.1 ion transporter [Roseospira navarrensis]